MFDFTVFLTTQLRQDAVARSESGFKAASRLAPVCLCVCFDRRSSRARKVSMSLEGARLQSYLLRRLPFTTIVSLEVFGQWAASYLT